MLIPHTWSWDALENPTHGPPGAGKETLVCGTCERRHIKLGGDDSYAKLPVQTISVIITGESDEDNGPSNSIGKAVITEWKPFRNLQG